MFYHVLQLCINYELVLIYAWWFPNSNASKSQEDQRAREKKECAFFRGTGCKKGDTCSFEHIRENEGAEKSKFEMIERYGY